MKRAKVFAAALLAAAAVSAPVAQATVTVKVLGAGSSAMWQTAATGAFLQLAGSGGGHMTVKGTCPTASGTDNCAQIYDSRSTSIVGQTGNLWVVWSNPAKPTVNVWAYISVDSVVGNRTYFATTTVSGTATRATSLQLDPATDGTGSFGLVPSGQGNLISPNLWGCDNGMSGAGCTSGNPVMPTNVYNALNNHIFTTGFTDIRPEDAYYASCRVLNPLDASGHADSLGYGTLTNCRSQTGTNIQSAVPTAAMAGCPPVCGSGTGNYAQPVNFKIKGEDPITHAVIRKFTTIDVGAQPIVIIVNRMDANGLGLTSSGLFQITDIELPDLQNLFSGSALLSPYPSTGCFATELNAGATSRVGVNPILREPMSGTMNTFEHTNIRCSGDAAVTTGCLGDPADTTDYPTVGGLSQESGVGHPSLPSDNDPLDLQCSGGGGYRLRAIGTGEMVGNGVKYVEDAIGYTFWGYGNVSKIAGSTSYGYLTLDGVDPIQTTYTTGELPLCTSSAGSGVCPAAPGSSFPHLRDGTYRSWSVVRAVTDSTGTNRTNTEALVTAIQNNVNLTTPDFVPFASTGGDPGLGLVRSHWTQSAETGNNGGTCGTEGGGDMGGFILTKDTCTTGEHQ